MRYTDVRGGALGQGGTHSKGVVVFLRMLNSSYAPAMGMADSRGMIISKRPVQRPASNSKAVKSRLNQLLA
jgi:hypothetical protein